MTKTKFTISFVAIAIFFYFIIIIYPIPAKSEVTGFKGEACYSIQYDIEVGG